MNTILWKELRENLKWAVLAMLGFGAGLTYAWSTVNNQFDEWRSYESICSNSFLLVTTFGSAAIGILLGLMQILTEARRDQWAFLIHRPVRRQTIFFGKVIAGVCLYLLATGIPLLVAVLWASKPGHIAAPFDWRMSLPGVADILTGIVFYLGAMLTGLRQARWYASRALGIVAAVGCAFLVVQCAEFVRALIFIAGFVVILLGAAWGSFLTTGNYASQPALAKVCLGISLSFGILVAGMAALMIGSSLFSGGNLYTQTEYKVDEEGRILKVVEEGNWVKSVTDLNGTPVNKPGFFSRFSLSGFLPSNRIVQTYRDETRRGYRYRYAGSYFQPIQGGDELAWYYVFDEGRIRGYSHRDKNLVGYLGPDGFSLAAKTNSARFEDVLRGGLDQNLLRFSHKAYRVELLTKQVILLATAPPNQTMRGAFEISSSYTNPESDRVLLVTTDNQIQAFTTEGKLLFVTPLLHDLKTYGTIQAAVMSKRERFFFWHSPSWKLEEQEKVAQLPIYLTEVASDGTVTKTHELPQTESSYNPSRWSEYVECFLIPPSACAAFLGIIKAGEQLGIPDCIDSWHRIQYENRKYPWRGEIICVFALLCVPIAFRASKVYGFCKSVQWGWSIATFLLGWPGLLMFAAIHDWPAREVCSACGKKRVVDRDRCEHCEAEFPMPALDGTDIFEKPTA